MDSAFALQILPDVRRMVAAAHTDVFPIVAICVLFGLVIVLLRLLRLRQLLLEPTTCIELTPYSGSDKHLDATKTMLAVLHGFADTRPIFDKLLQRSPVFSFEIVSTRTEGIRFIVRIPTKYVQAFEKHIASYASDVAIQQIEDYLVGYQAAPYRMVQTFKQTGHYAYPLKMNQALQNNDPFAYLAGAMTNPNAQEMISVQLVVSPVKLRRASMLAGKVLHNEKLLHTLGKHRFVAVWRQLIYGINEALFMVTDGVGEAVHGPGSSNTSPQKSIQQHKQAAAKRIKPARSLSAIESSLSDEIYEKLTHQLYQVDIRTMVFSDSKQAAASYAASLRHAFAAYDWVPYQTLRVRTNFLARWAQSYRWNLFLCRLPAVFGSRNILGTHELANIYHFPHSISAQIDNVQKRSFRTLPAPAVMKKRADAGEFDVTLGRNVHHGVTTEIGLTVEERERHMYIVGGTGNGKSTLMKYAIVQDIRNGKGVAVVDPHGDLALELLNYIPEERLKDVIYFNPSDIAHPIGMNLLELPKGLSEEEALIEQDFLTESIISIFRKTFSKDDTGGHRIEYVLRNAIHTALTIEGATLFTVLKLLRDSKYRNVIVRKLKDPELKEFWVQEIGKAGEFQRVRMSAGITAKIDRYQRSESVKRIIGQSKATIDFDEILNGKILICNLAKGLIGEDTSELLGISILSKLQMAAYRRIRMSQADRRPFYLYVDEFQNFANLQFLQILSEARKYKLFLTMAEQSTAQHEEERMVEVILNNVGTVVCFRTGSTVDEDVILPRFSPLVREGELNNLPARTFYIRVQAKESFEPMSGETVLAENVGSGEAMGKVVEASRKNFGKHSALR